MHFPIHRAEIIEVIDENNFEVVVADVGVMHATRSSKVKRSLPGLNAGDIVAVQFSPHDQTRCRITYKKLLEGTPINATTCSIWLSGL